MTQNNRTNRIHIALLQSDIAIGEPEINKQHLRKLCEQAVYSSEKPDVIMLPEMWNTGYALDSIHTIADIDGADTKAWLSEFAREHSVNIIGGSIAEKRGQDIYNVMYAFNRQGEIVAEYSKIHLFRLMDEEKYLSAGEKPVTFELENTSSGASICYDIRFPELTRTLALKGAKVLFVPAEWPYPRLHHWRTLLTARAIENQMYVVACNRVGTSGDTTFFGHSLIIDPWGEIIAEGGEEEQIITGGINVETVSEVRSRIPIFEDRRPELYF
ncbi:carbon-nitrogen family hydrolase [Paenibacillus sediminis]|uniref:Amidohydrolase n=1 Tax=Paenibacillus sediminis TaxID=664909 RepID=A0ABS4H038_9BACL|nr:carbon-nitrogen family hydrolase [Paenibacillus sediminis]MBP1935826.1 putative amidohydrolase [Paenibacillus sediminis]